MRKLPGYSRLQTLFVNTITGASSAFVLAGSRGPSTRELASNEYPGTRCFTPGNRGDSNFSSPKARSLCSTTRMHCIPASSASSERRFSMEGLTLTQKWMRLKSTRVAQLATVRIAVAGGLLDNL